MAKYIKLIISIPKRISPEQVEVDHRVYPHLELELSPGIIRPGQHRASKGPQTFVWDDIRCRGHFF